ncbi:RBBP9/YdeN family alpha/beta hydrolase [Mesorhizobium yinganensis]|uniref:RBBP9/YdeN family alpha/beta hydrolase n=1 Tax=Mesorhizobium yinganensis TaxID=3157707 RepID=UPI0032B7DF38
MIDTKGSFDFLALPGRGNCGPDHWMSHWCQVFSNSSRVLQAEWDRPEPNDWIARVDAAVEQAPRKLVLLAHSLAVATTVKWAVEANEGQLGKIAGALLVAPTNVADPDPSFDLVRPFAPMPLKPLPFPTLVVASRSDPRVTFDKALAFADAWGAELADAGDLGHMGNEARLGIWPTGLLLLGRLLERARI